MLGWRQRKGIIHTSPWRTQRKQPLLEHSLPCVKYTYVPTTVSLNISLRERNLCSDTNLYTIHCTNICNSPQNQIQQKCPSMGKWIKNKTNLFFFWVVFPTQKANKQTWLMQQQFGWIARKLSVVTKVSTNCKTLDKFIIYHFWNETITEMGTGCQGLGMVEMGNGHYAFVSLLIWDVIAIYGYLGNFFHSE